MKSLKRTLAIGMVLAMTGLTYAETPLPARGPLPFTAFDQDGNGSISRAEFEAVHGQRLQTPNPQGYSVRRRMDPPDFASFDSDGNGSLSPDELANGQRNRMLQRRPRMGGMGGNPAMGPGRGRNMPAFGEFDLNGDGYLTQQEFEQARANRIRQRAEQGYLMRNLQNAPPYADIDSNGDGAVTPDEFSAAQMRHRMNRMQNTR